MSDQFEKVEALVNDVLRDPSGANVAQALFRIAEALDECAKAIRAATGQPANPLFASGKKPRK